jgi:hypothetical protein
MIHQSCGEDTLMKRLTCAALALGLLLANCSPAPACVFHSRLAYVTFREHARQASAILYGTLANPRRPVNDPASLGTTDLHILKVIKSDPALGKRRVIPIPQYFPVPDLKNPPQVLIFVDVHKGKLDPYRGVEVASPDVVDYLKKAMALDDKDAAGALGYFFGYLGHADKAIATDAFEEFDKADFQAVRAAAKFYSAQKLARWLQDPKTPADRRRIFALLLGLCGKAEHTRLLREMLDDPIKGQGAGAVGMLTAYTMLNPADGWAYLKRILGNEKEDFLRRCAALQTVRFLGEKATDVMENKKLAKKDLVQGLCLLLHQGDIDDLAVECLRQWQRWETTEQVLELFDKKTRDLSAITRRAILRFAMTAEKYKHPAQAKAKAFVQRMRRLDPDWVKDTAELLELEKEPTPKLAPAPVKPK